MARIYQRNPRNGIYWIDYWRDGRMVKQTLKTANKKRAKEIADALAKKLALEELAGHAPAPAGGAPTLSELLDKYLQWAPGAERRPKTIYAAQRAVGHFDKIVPTSPLLFRTDDDLERWKAEIERFKRTHRAAGYEKNSVNIALRSLRALVSRAQKQGWYSGVNPFKGVELLPIPRTIANQKPIFSPDEEDRMVEASRRRNRSCYLFSAIARDTGMRKNEVVEQRWENCRFGDRIILIKHSRTFETKTHSERVLPMSDRLKAILEADPGRLDVGYILAPHRPATNADYRYDIKNVFKSAAVDAGVKWATPNTWRHTFITRRVKAGVSVDKVAEWVGNSPEVIRKTYLHLNEYDPDIESVL